MDKTQKDSIMAFVLANPGKTATEIAVATGIRVANVSSVLVKGFYANHFKREKPEGSKGWIYFLS